MKQKTLDVFLYISSFIPLYLLVVLKTLLEIINQNLTFNFTNTILITIMLILTILGIVGVVYLFKKEEKEIKSFRIVKAQNMTDKHFLGYFSLVVLFALTFDLSKVSMSVVYLIILIMIGIVYVKNNLFYINPLLNIIGFSFYQVDYIDEAGNICSTKVYFKGKLNLAKYKVACNKNGICFVVAQTNE